MPVATERQVRDALAAGRHAPVYLLVGDDGAGKGALVEALESSVDEASRAFNVERFYADESDAGEVVAAARTLSFFGSRRIIIVFRAEHWFRQKAKAAEGDEEGPDADAASAGGGGSALEDYLAAPVAESTVVFVASDVNRTLRATKLLIKSAVIVEFWGLKSDKEAKGPGAAREAFERGALFVRQELEEAGLSIDRGGLSALLEHAGTDIGTLRNSVGQLVSYAAGRSRVNAEDVLALVRGTALVNDWALIDAVGAGQVRDALEQLRLQLDEGRSPFQILGMLGWWVRERLPGVREWQVPVAVGQLLEADLALKSSADSQIVLERFVVELCEGGRQAARRRP
jgi:DNA polymerase-3 subunit delta